MATLRFASRQYAMPRPLGQISPETGIAWAPPHHHMHSMSRRSPLDDPKIAAHAWARYKRLLRWMVLGTIAVVILALLVLYSQAGTVSIHFYIAAALGIGFSVLLTAALMGLVFLSSGTGHDEAVSDATDEGQSSDRSGDGRKR